MSDEHGQFESLMRQLQEGSEEAARELCATYWDYILRCVRRRLRPALRPTFDSIDFVQKMWKSVFEDREKLRQFDSPKALKRYLAAIAIHKVQDAGRRIDTYKYDSSREQRIDEHSDSAGPHPVSRDPTPSAMAVYYEEFDRLFSKQPPEVKKVVALRFEGKPFEEIAEQLDIDEKTARKVIRRLRETSQRASDRVQSRNAQIRHAHRRDGQRRDGQPGDPGTHEPRSE